jgi:hypothetical protein
LKAVLEFGVAELLLLEVPKTEVTGAVFELLLKPNIEPVFVVGVEVELNIFPLLLLLLLLLLLF